MEDLTTYQKTALQITKAGNEIATAEQLADYRAAVDASGRRLHPRYKDGSEQDRLSWLSKQFFGLGAITHTQLTAASVGVDIMSLDEEIMKDAIMREMTLTEMQEAFKSGVFKEYGEYYGLTAVSMHGFLKGYLRGEKRVAASAIYNRRRIKAEQEANSKFFRELYEAHRAGMIDLPDFTQMRINGPQAKKTITAEESAAHRAKVRQQAEEILKQARNGKEEKPQQ